MAANGNNAKHKNLASSFGGGAPAPERGAKLQGLLRVGAPADAAMDPAPQPATPPAPVGPQSPAAGTPDAPQAQARPRPAEAPDEPAGAVATRVAPPRRKRVTGGGGVPASSVYLTSDAYKQLQNAKRTKIKDYAQIVQDAFAQLAKEAREENKSPEEAIADLFKVPESDDPWLMPSSTTRAKSEEPLTEARISFSAQQRSWIESKMEILTVGVTFSEFIARVLEHHLQSTKRRKRTKKAESVENGSA